MNCRRVEKLIPLYVEGDLEAGVADRISSHLEWCGRCIWLADDYKESQCWLRSSDAPEFDDAALSALKAGVLRRLAETDAKPSLLASFVQQWSRRQVFALSAATLIIFAVVVFYIYQSRTSVKPSGVEVVAKTPSTEPAATNETPPDTGKAPGADLKRGPVNVRTSSKPRGVSRRVPERTLERPLLSQKSSLYQPAIDISATQDDLPEMLRIEIQTSDPNIRIIWFAPKEVEGPQTDQ